MTKRLCLFFIQKIEGTEGKKMFYMKKNNQKATLKTLTPLNKKKDSKITKEMFFINGNNINSIVLGKVRANRTANIDKKYV